MKKCGKVTGRSIRFGVIGVGAMGKGHCRILGEIREAELSAVCDNDASALAEAGRDFGVPTFNDHRQLIKASLCDVVIISTPHPEHPKIAIDCANAGLHILCEKPLSERVSTADKMIEAARVNGVAFGVDFPKRTDPKIVKALEFVRAGNLGTVRRRTMILAKYRAQSYYDSGGWRGTWRGEGGGVIMNQAPHMTDLFIVLGGMPCRVFGRAQARLHNIEVEDVAEAIFEYADGSTGYFHCSTNESGPGNMIEIAGDAGKICYRDNTLRLMKFKPRIDRHVKGSRRMWGGVKCVDVPFKLKPLEESTHALVTRNFAQHLLKREKLIAPAAEAVQSLELSNAVLLSAHRGRYVDLPLDRSAYDRFLAKKRKESKCRKKPSKYVRETDPSHSHVVKG